MIESQDSTTKENLEQMDFDELMKEKKLSDDMINQIFQNEEIAQKLKDENFFMNKEQRNLINKQVTLKFILMTQIF